MARPISQQIIERMSTQQNFRNRVRRCDLVFRIKIHFCFDNHIAITAKQLQNINLSLKTFVQINLPLIVFCILISLEFFENMRICTKRAQRVILLDAYNSET